MHACTHNQICKFICTTKIFLFKVWKRNNNISAHIYNALKKKCASFICDKNNEKITSNNSGKGHHNKYEGWMGYSRTYIATFTFLSYTEIRAKDRKNTNEDINLSH
jgi:hypothetical protein